PPQISTLSLHDALPICETSDEVLALLRDLRDVDVDVATIGQYLQPTRRNLPVAAYIEPRQFDDWREYGLSLGFQMVFSGPLVRRDRKSTRLNSSHVAIS